MKAVLVSDWTGFRSSWGYVYSLWFRGRNSPQRGIVVAYGAKYWECHDLVWDRTCTVEHSNLSRVATKAGKDPRSAIIIELSRAG